MKYRMLIAVMFLFILVFPTVTVAEMTLEPQTSTTVGAPVDLKENSAAGAAQPSKDMKIQGVQEYKGSNTAEVPEPVKASQESKPESSEKFDIEEYMEVTKQKLREFDIKYDILDKIKSEDGHYDLHTPDRWVDRFYEITGEFGPQRSVVSLGTRPNGNLFKSVRFACTGDYQANGVYFSERDLNSNNGSQWEWDSYNEGQRRTMTDKVEAFFYHDLLLNPRFEFAEGMITLHTQFKHGGYVWETAFPNYRFEEPYFWGAHGQMTDLDTTTLSMTGLFLEAMTPVGAILAGKLPEDPTMGLTGVAWGCPIPPMFGLMGAFGGFYGKIMEGMIWDDDRKNWEGHGWDYIEVQNGDGYKDEDDLTAFGGGGGGTMEMPFIGGRAYGGAGYVAIQGGDESIIFSGTDINVVAAAGRYTRGSLKANGVFATLFGTAINLSSDTYYGDLFDKMENLYNEAMDIMDVTGTKYRYYDLFELMPRKLKIDPVFLVAGNASFDFGPFTPEGCIIYAQGAEDPWQIPMIVPGFLFQSEGNRTPQGMLKSYLLNEVERKYFYLIGTPALALAQNALGFIDMFSTNITAVKAGSTLRLSKHFSAYGQVVSAWRTNVEYYKKNYWDYFILTKNFKDMEWSYDDSGMRQIAMDAILQFSDEEYHERDIDNYLGLELSTKLTFHIREGLDLSLIGAYFKPGDFYEDILSPKRYSSIKAMVSDVTGQVGFADLDEEIIYGPYEASRLFDLTDAYTVQFKFDLKWDD